MAGKILATFENVGDEVIKRDETLEFGVDIENFGADMTATSLNISGEAIGQVMDLTGNRVTYKLDTDMAVGDKFQVLVDTLGESVIATAIYPHSDGENKDVSASEGSIQRIDTNA